MTENQLLELWVKNIFGFVLGFEKWGEDIFSSSFKRLEFFQ